MLTTHVAGQNWISLLLTRQVAALLLQYFCLSYVWYFYITWLPTYLREGWGQSAQRAAALAVLPLLFGGFGSLTGRHGVAAAAEAGDCVWRLFCDSSSAVRVHADTCGGAGDAGDGPGQLCQRLDDADFLGHLRGDRRSLYGDRRGCDEHAGKPGWIRCAGDWRSHSAAGWNRSLERGIC